MSNNEKAGHENDQPDSSESEQNSVAEDVDHSAQAPDQDQKDQDQVEKNDVLSEAENIVNEAVVQESDHLADLQRLQAEYVNYRKRVERDRAVAGDMAVQRVLEALLPVLDDIEAARQHGDLEEGPFAAIASKLDSSLEKFSLTRYVDVDVDFDPHIHEALIQQPSREVTAEKVTQILRAGYKVGDRVIRAAQVIVSVPEN